MGIKMEESRTRRMTIMLTVATGFLSRRLTPSLKKVEEGRICVI